VASAWDRGTSSSTVEILKDIRDEIRGVRSQFRDEIRGLRGDTNQWLEANPPRPRSAESAMT
jgi:hypothetical protein